MEHPSYRPTARMAPLNSSTAARVAAILRGASAAAELPTQRTGWGLAWALDYARDAISRGYTFTREGLATAYYDYLETAYELLGLSEPAPGTPMSYDEIHERVLGWA